MTNKNDFSDLFEFFTGIAAVVFVVAVFVFYGLSQINPQTVDRFKAGVVNYEKYIDRQWGAGAATTTTPKFFQQDFLPW
jgi:hypothetical protein